MGKPTQENEPKKFKVKHALSVLGVAVVALGAMGFMLIDGMKLSDKEIITELEEQYDTKIDGIKYLDSGSAPNSLSTGSNEDRLYLVTTQPKKSEESLTFSIIVGKADNKKEYIKSSSYVTDVVATEVGAKLETFEKFISEIGFEYDRGGLLIPVDAENVSKDRKREDIQEPYSVGVTDDGTAMTRISLLYKEPLTLFTLDASYDDLYNAVKAVKGMELENPYLSIRGKDVDGDTTSGRVMITDLATINSSEDLYNAVKGHMDTSAIPSISVDDTTE